MKSFIAFLLLVILALSGCKRDYPDGTPKWLREKITQFKRTGKSGDINACTDGSIRIEECRESTTGATLYCIIQTDPTYIHYYDMDGHELGAIFELNCNYSSGGAGCPVGSYNSNNIQITQLIWTPKHCD